MNKKDLTKKEKERLKKQAGEFKNFLLRGNILDLAVGVILGTAFSKIVSSLVEDVFMPIIGIFLGGVDFTGLSLKVGDSVIKYGSFIQNIIDFLIVALCVFIFIKIISNIMSKLKIEEEKKPEKKPDDIKLLEEIRDILKK